MSSLVELFMAVATAVLIFIPLALGMFFVFAPAESLRERYREMRYRISSMQTYYTGTDASDQILRFARAFGAFLILFGIAMLVLAVRQYVFV